MNTHPQRLTPPSPWPGKTPEREDATKELPDVIKTTAQITRQLEKAPGLEEFSELFCVPGFSCESPLPHCLKMKTESRPR